MIEIMFKWYYIPALIVVTIVAIREGLRRDLTFIKLLLYIIFFDACIYAGMVVGENILRLFK